MILKERIFETRSSQLLAPPSPTMMAEEGRQGGEGQAGEFVQPASYQSPSIQTSTQSLELGTSSIDNLTFTKSKIRSDEERLLVVKGYRSTLRLSFLLVVLSASLVAAILLAVFWTSRHEAPFDVSEMTSFFHSAFMDKKFSCLKVWLFEVIRKHLEICHGN
ncbi:uncharacterized protein LOC113209869 isoform X2 [Frankliniella occidentalis]|uniref:Uncharacterized protein LOC113209869 isoform X2 n=1 Tax=Frankliniella occidentalis TaxID=133901 RepID=A0A6J1SR80_FRAOC|nr:uncharacterized protein LOC113209869 isoform X2 [Frankliniella occidentalis]XP_052130642.1 uncharacterized protein LOC113209869 isoform X2 [Frankliniella occidentalis]